MSDVSVLGHRIAEAVAQTVSERFCHPTATYRLQFEKEKLTFRAAAAIVPYLHELGISHLYASPYLKINSGTTNNYAVVDYSQLNPDLGSETDYRALVEALHGCGMGQILDTVPNHMSATPLENPWWTDVLENGPGSPHAAYFDIDWHPVKEDLHNRVLLPILGNQYGQVLEAGELKLEYRQGGFLVSYYQVRLPLEPRSYRVILTYDLDNLRGTLPADSEELRELESIVTALEHMPGLTETAPERVAERQREKEVIKGRLRALTERAPPVAAFIDRNVQEFNGKTDDPHSYDRLDKLLNAQVYRLSHWKAAADEINYRRFFDVNDLAAVCMEDAQVFAESHELVFDLLVRGDVDALRIDHIDGLYDPSEYLRRLQAGYLRALGMEHYQRSLETSGPPSDAPTEAAEAAPPPWSAIEPAFLQKVTALTFADRVHLPLYVLVEKILGPAEALPEEWLVAGTTGYDFLNVLGGLFVEPAGLAELTRLCERFIGERLDFRDVAYQSKQLILHTSMSSELQLLAQRLNRISERHRRSRDFTLNTLRVALREILACFPVYRTYISRGNVSERDRQVLCRATAQAKRHNTNLDVAAFDFVRDVLLLEAPPDADEAAVCERDLFVGRFQQVTSPVTAKGIEDTAFYRYFPLASLDEVGGAPSRGGVSIEEFHRHNLARQKQWPRSLLSTTTHDSKRSEDLRARISVLSEIPRDWRAAVNRWARLDRRHRSEVDGQPAPSRNDEYLFYQCLTGAWPLAPPRGKDREEFLGRMQGYMEKATHEAKVHTSWMNPNPQYDAAVRQFVAAVLDEHPKKNRFLPEFTRFHEQVVNWGLYAALSQALLKLTVPGVPDVYQGQELWDFSLVDPDNRRAVDFAPRREMLERLKQDAGCHEQSLAPLARQLALDPRDARLKLFLTWRTLQFRGRQPELFQSGEYIPLAAEGTRAKHVCAFARRLPAAGPEPPMALVIVPRWIAQLTPLGQDSQRAPPPLGGEVWEDTSLVTETWMPQSLRNLFTGQECTLAEGPLRLGMILADFPVAVLTNV
jgi:(1->4)-alpha-D-glucan 1-alpha-D-glucosylmutase